jgi:hypothetical protein
MLSQARSIVQQVALSLAAAEEVWRLRMLFFPFLL